MSDKKNLSDYNKPRTDLNKLLPANMLKGAKILEGFDDNLFNRFFTKDEVERIIGFIGSDPQNKSLLEQIVEPTDFRQANQLQPLLYNKVGNVDWFMSFVDFMNRLSRLGVDIDRFNEWGNSLQFNWIPPIDLDKLINYQDYFWASSDFNDPPQYITIKNQANWADGRLSQTLESVTSGLTSFPIVEYDEPANSIIVSGDQLAQFRLTAPAVVTGAGVNSIIVTPIALVYDNVQNTTSIEFDVSEYNIVIGVNDNFTEIASTEIDLLETNESARKIFVSGDITEIFTHGYVFSSEDSPSKPITLWKVESSSYDLNNNQTSIILTDDIVDFDWDRITVKPIIRSMQAEQNVISNDPFSRSQFLLFTEEDMGDIIWLKNILLFSGTTGLTEGTELGSNLFTDTTGGTDYLSGAYSVGDIVRISGTGFDDDYPIENIVTSDILGLKPQFFTQAAISYELIRERLLTDISSDTPLIALSVNELWYDTLNNQLRQWNGAIWVVRVQNFGYLVDLTFDAHLVDLSQNNDWTDQNKWIHRNEIISFTGTARAQHPIIEYFPYVKLSEHSFANKEWRYRRDSLVSYASTRTEPTLFELIDTRITTGGLEIAFQDATTIIFDDKFGNLTPYLTAGTIIQLGDFGVNTGEAVVVSSEFIQLTPTDRFRTRMVIEDPVVDPLFVPEDAFIAPKLTSEGDPWISFEVNHWQFEGIEDIAASSVVPIRNPMLDVIVSSILNGSVEEILGLAFQEFKLVDGTPSIFGPTVTLDDSLHDMCLFEDFQEGDIRVYLNGERQYGNFADEPSLIDPNFTGGITFSSDVEITDIDIVRIEVGEYALDEVGKRAVSISTSAGIEVFNLVDNRRIEQEKTERSQYPWFNIYDVNNNPLIIASNLFRYKDDPDGTFLLDLDQRVTFDETTQDYTLEQDLIDEDTGELYVYFDGRELNNEFQSIWKKGLFNEQYTPVEENGFWEIPNQLYFNVEHKNRNEIKLTEIFPHFNSIIEEQTAPGINRNRFSNVYHLDCTPNHGLGGRIKEHNDGFDTLLSAMFVNNVNPLDLISFANARYDGAQLTLFEIFEDNVVSFFTEAVDQNDLPIDDVEGLINFIVEEIKDIYEKNDRLDQWFGDSTTHDEITKDGVKNWVATTPFFGLAPKIRPHIINENNSTFIQVIHHDGHRKDIELNAGIETSIFNQVLSGTNSDEQTVTTEAAPFPVTINGEPVASGDYLVRTNTTAITRKLYRFSTLNVWEEINISLLYAEIILHIENALYDILSDDLLPENFVSNYDFSLVQSDIDYPIKIQEQFSVYVSENNIAAPFLNTQYQQNNPFTWNYGFTNIQTDPITGLVNTTVFSAWQALYESVFGTPYPHLEPWILQGYSIKPAGWDAEYLDFTETRKWLLLMWTNILAGIVPLGQNAPNGDAGTGLPNQITELFTYLPVNIEATATSDGYEPDALIPPYWNSDNSPNPAVRSLHDASLQEFIITPSAGFQFGQIGPDEWDWTVSSNKLYDNMIVAFKIQPLKFTNQTFGPELIDVACLQVDDRINKVASHENIFFHGDIKDDNTVFKANGLNQWYVHFNRYNGFDGVSSEFRQMWREWEAPLTYQFAAFIDTQNFKISSEFFDFVNRDFEILFKKTSGIRDVWLDALKTTLLSSPSRFSSEVEAGLDWTVSFNNTSPIGNPIQTFGVQNYPVLIEASNDTFKIFSFPINSADVTESFGFDTVQYSETANSEVSTELPNDATTFLADVEFDNAIIVNLVITGSTSQTFGDLVDVINDQIGVNGTAFLEDGSLVIKSNTIGGLTFCTITDAGLFSSVSSNFQGTTGNAFNPISFEKVFFLEDDVTKYFTPRSTFDIVSSTNFDGTYTVASARYDIDSQLTRIEIEEEISITDSTVDGFIEPQSGVSMPDEWVTGVGLNWNTNGTLPAPFNNISLYYMIRISDNEFQLSTSREGALAGTGIIIPLTTGINQNYIGRTQNSFAAFNARSVEVFWKQHFVDSRVINTFPTPITISGVQNMIDFINGYRGFLSVAGFLYDDVDGTNRDSTTGRVNDWQLETEKLIEFLYGSKDTQQELQETYSLIPDFITNTFTSPDNITWVTGTRVTLNSPDGTLPLEFENAIASFIPYFVIQTVTPGVLQLAGSIGQARNGVALTFSDNGTGSTILKLSPAMTLFPSIELNPHKQSIFINHETGIVSNVVEGNNLDLITNQRVYDSDNVTLLNDDLIVSRKDLRTQIELSNGRITDNTNNPATARDIGGMHIFFDGFEHVIQFNNSSISGALIYDAFLGINTLRFNLELDRQDSFTLRPNVGGSVIIDQSQVQNIESAADSLRLAYSTYKSKEGDEITQKVRDALGYDGPHDFADDIGITNKSQFIFYRGLIQKKGTNFAADAFANQLIYDELVTDEFWAFRIDHYGDAKEKIYPELQLFSTEVGRRELRLEFIPPLGSVSDASFFPIDLTDETRWFDQPDQVEKLLPRDRFYINVKVVERFEDVVNSPSYINRNGSFYLELSEPADAAFMSYQAIVGPPIERGFLTAGVDFIFITNTLIKFISNKNPTSVNLVDVSTLSYNFNAQNPAKIINRNTNVVVTEVPIWNPARQNYFFGAIYGVTFRRDSDPAQYGVRITIDPPHDNRWDNRFKDKVWFDTHSEHYLPFDDSFIKPDINERMTNWGKIAPYGEIKVFQWTESDVLPEEYDDLAIIEENDGTLPVDERKTGRVRQVLFRNDGTPITPIWVEEDDVHFDFVAEIVTATTYTDEGAPLNTPVQVYIDGVAEPTQSTFATAGDFKTFADGVTGVTIHVVDEKTIPTALQITDLDFKFDTPYTVIDSVDAVSGRTILTYYFWVEDRISSIPILGGPTRKTTLRTVKAGLENIPTPYMIPNNIVDISTVEYADIFSTNSPEKEITLSYEFPFTYNQVIVRGLDDFVPSEDFYTLRFTRDFSLRDRLVETNSPDLSDIQRKNVHWEWKLFREKQLEKIDLVLWNAITESMLGFEFDGEPLSTVEATPVPSITPSVTPTLTPFLVTPTATSGSSPTPTPTHTVTPTPTQTVTPTVTPTKNASPTPTVTPTVSNTPGIVVTVTPTLTPDVTPTQTVTPTVTPSTTIPASPLPSVTPSNTPVASPTPTPAGVNIIDHTIEDVHPTGGLAIAAIAVREDGSLTSGGDTTSPSIGSTEWHSSNPSGGIGAGFDVRLVTISGTLWTSGFGSGELPDVWLNLSISKGFRVFGTTSGAGSFSGTLEIRDAGTLVVLGSAVITLSAISL